MVGALIDPQCGVHFVGQRALNLLSFFQRKPFRYEARLGSQSMKYSCPQR
jgi:hypothetical protein